VMNTYKVAVMNTYIVALMITYKVVVLNICKEAVMNDVHAYFLFFLRRLSFACFFSHFQNYFMVII
jgi:hypothetical protein